MAASFVSRVSSAYDVVDLSAGSSGLKRAVVWVAPGGAVRKVSYNESECQKKNWARLGDTFVEFAKGDLKSVPASERPSSPDLVELLKYAREGGPEQGEEVDWRDMLAEPTESVEDLFEEERRKREQWQGRVEQIKGVSDPMAVAVFAMNNCDEALLAMAQGKEGPILHLPGKVVKFEIEDGRLKLGLYSDVPDVGGGGSKVIGRLDQLGYRGSVAANVIALHRDRHFSMYLPEAEEALSFEARVSQELQQKGVVNAVEMHLCPWEGGVHALKMARYSLGNAAFLVNKPEVGESYTGQDLSDRLRCFLDVVDFLIGLHDRCNKVHGDIKPENFLLCQNEKGLGVKVCDYGSVRAFGQPIGDVTPRYAPPEAENPRLPAQPSLDLWALGLSLKELVYGRRDERDDVDLDACGSNQIINSVIQGLCREHPDQRMPLGDAKKLVEGVLRRSSHSSLS